MPTPKTTTPPKPLSIFEKARAMLQDATSFRKGRDHAAARTDGASDVSAQLVTANATIAALRADKASLETQLAAANRNIQTTVAETVATLGFPASQLPGAAPLSTAEENSVDGLHSRLLAATDPSQKYELSFALRAAREREKAAGPIAVLIAAALFFVGFATAHASENVPAVPATPAPVPTKETARANVAPLRRKEEEPIFSQEDHEALQGYEAHRASLIARRDAADPRTFRGKFKAAVAAFSESRTPEALDEAISLNSADWDNETLMHNFTRISAAVDSAIAHLFIKQAKPILVKGAETLILRAEAKAEEREKAEKAWRAKNTEFLPTGADESDQLRRLKGAAWSAKQFCENLKTLNVADSIPCIYATMQGMGTCLFPKG